MISVSQEIVFDKNTGRRLDANVVGTIEGGVDNWPVVYVLSNDEEVYVGETTNIRSRLAQHFENPDRKRLEVARIISDATFNKSVIVDLESFLIAHMGADSRFKVLQNGNAGQQKHNYFQKEMYEAQFGGVWQKLEKIHLANKGLTEIENSNLFKYSPYKTLTTDQYDICFKIVETLAGNLKEARDSTFIVNGDPGTGKTILAIYLMKLLGNKMQDDVVDENEPLLESLALIQKLRPKLRIGLVISMENLRVTLEQVFKETYGLNKSMVLSPSEVARSSEKFDILIVDEAHRLKTARNLSSPGEYNNIYDNNLALGLDKMEGTQLDWIMQKSHHQIFFYDARQSIKRTDVDAEKFNILLDKKDTYVFTLTTQMRCGEEGKEYVDYIKAIFSNNPPEKHHFNQYDVKLFDNVKVMTDLIREKDAENGVGLSRVVAGYAWPWPTRNLKSKPVNREETEKLIKSGQYDIDIDGFRYIWNTKRDGWVTSPNSVNEVGCIHTIQGFDLNYAGVIIGEELSYDFVIERFYLNRGKYHDTTGKNSTDDEELLEYILNIYKVLCTRGMRGTYIHVCDKNLRKYLGRFFDAN